jgi:type VI secretion system secreted protein VgrG
MDSGGQILLEGTNVTLVARDTLKMSGKKVETTGGESAKMGVGNQNVVCDKQKVATSGAAVNTSAVGMHEITGAVVKIN